MGALLIVMLVIAQPAITVLVAIYLYALSAPVTAFYYRSTRRRPPGEGPPPGLPDVPAGPGPGSPEGRV